LFRIGPTQDEHHKAAFGWSGEGMGVVAEAVVLDAVTFIRDAAT
jgi:hypothetical protein